LPSKREHAILRMDSCDEPLRAGETHVTFRCDDRDIDEAAVAAQRGRAPSLLFHKQLVGKRLYYNSVVRFMVAGGIVVGALGATHVLGVEGLDVPALIGLALVLTVFNVGVYAVVRNHRRLERRVPEHRFLCRIMHVTIDVDFVFLTVALWLVGGVKSPFQAFYLLHVILAAAFLSPFAAWAHAVFGYALFAGLVVGQWWGLISTRLPVGAVNSAQPIVGRFVLTVLVVQAILMGLAVFLVTSITWLLRRGEKELHTTNAELHRVSKIQRDFLHVALHDMKSPVSAATMLIHGLKVASNPPLTEQQSHWVERIQARLDEAMVFLHDFAILAALDATDMGRQAEAVDLGAEIRSAVDENLDMAHAHNHSVNIELPEELPRVRGIRRLIHEAVANLVTNANKYTPDNGTISVRALHHDGVVRVEVEDNGIGIAPEDQKQLFQEFVRIKHTDGPMAQVTGSGLGLSIVRRIVDAHGGRAGVASDLGKGSVFFIELPVEKAAAASDPS